MSDAWDVFTASLDPVELEQERCRVSLDLSLERPHGRRHRQMVFDHDRAAKAFWAKADSGSWIADPEPAEPAKFVAEVPVKREGKPKRRRKVMTVIPADRQLEIALRALEAAEGAVTGPASGLGDVFSGSAHEYQSESPNGSTGVLSDTSSNERKVA